ncbi:transporter substrate-binding domain-containing protein [Lactococcus nasutitermitis]|uniref:Transporter substrate-binding domain-containing protein n=1 Tax=Lactococcus nasutitermitis TaxID=1652957 RepID=A0ABV9JEQ9_9LACT|nr:transporter substrate-binding domain-containing protein [Lactococcus nasutitermitis]
MKKRGVTYALVALSIVVMIGLSACSNTAKGTSHTKAHQKIVIATGAYPKPYAYEENGKLKGFDIDLARAVFKNLPQYSVSFEKVEFPSILPGLDTNRYQMGANSFAKSKERDKNYLFSEALYSNPMGIIVPKNSKIKDFNDLAGRKTTVEPAVSYSVIEEDYNQQHPNHKIQLSYTKEDVAKQFENVQNGKIDFKLESLIIARQVIKDQGLNLKVIEVPEGTIRARAAYSYFIFAKTENGKHLSEKVNKVLDKLRSDGTLKKLSEKYYGKDYIPDENEAQK